MKYLLIDTQNIAYRNFKITPKTSPTEERIGLTFNNIFIMASNAYQAYDADHAIFCFDSRSWRKDVYPQYKANRKTAKQKMSVKEQQADDELREKINEFREFISKHTNASVLMADPLEADDLIAAWIREHPDDEHIIVSNDSDFVQLISDNVNIYNGKHFLTKEGAFDDRGRLDPKAKVGKNYINENHDYRYELFLKCIRGDTSDNIFSAYPGVREKSSKNKVGIYDAYVDMSKKGFNWNNFMNATWRDHNGNIRTVKDEYEINKQLIDLERVPDDIKEQSRKVITEQINMSHRPSVGIQFMRFCKKWQLNRLMSQADKIGKLLNKPYVQENKGE